MDVSGLEPPEPLVETLEAAQRLGRGGYLRMLHRREPCLLFPYLDRAGFGYEVRRGRRTAVEVFIWRDGDAAAETAARAAAAALPPWDGGEGGAVE